MKEVEEPNCTTYPAFADAWAYFFWGWCYVCNQKGSEKIIRADAEVLLMSLLKNEGSTWKHQRQCFVSRDVSQLGETQIPV
jgi:hypothetical protein